MKEPSQAARELYLDLMKRTLTNLIYVDVELSPIKPRGWLRSKIIHALLQRGIRLAHARRGDAEKRLTGADFSDIPHTMIGMKRLDNLQYCVEQTLADRIPGDLIETGVMRGGAVIFMRAILKVHGDTERLVWAADSFEGLPAPNVEKYPADAGAAWHLHPLGEVSVEHVRRNFARYGLLDDQVRFLKGWFKDTLATAPIERLAVLRLDGDLYESTMDALVPLYPKLSVGGFLIVDDYELPACRQAIHDYRAANGITEEILPIDQSGIYWRKAK